METNERRAYQRSPHFDCEAKISHDGQRWKVAEVYDVSSGGLKLRAEISHELGTILWFDLTLHSFLTEFEIKTQGVIRRVEQKDGFYLYGIAFKGLSPDAKIRIDENVNNHRPKNMWH